MATCPFFGFRKPKEGSSDLERLALCALARGQNCPPKTYELPAIAKYAEYEQENVNKVKVKHQRANYCQVAG